MRTFVLVAAVTTFHLANSPKASAQTSRLTGLVRDFCGLVLPGTTVTLVHESGNGARAVVDGEGRYSIATLVPGQWTVTFALLGFERQEQAIWLPEGGSLELNPRLTRDPNLKEALTVTHEDPSIRYHKYSVHGLRGEPVAAATIRFREVGSTASRATDCRSDDRNAAGAVSRFGDCEIDMRSRTATRRGRPLALTTREFALLAYLAANPGRALSRDVILNAVWGRSIFVTPRSVDRCITTLRAKVEADSHNPVYIQTIREVGYRFEPGGKSNGAWSQYGNNDRVRSGPRGGHDETQVSHGCAGGHADRASACVGAPWL